MSTRDVRSTDELVADYVRASMSVKPPATLNADVMRVVGLVAQERRTWLSTFGPYTPAIAAVAASLLIVAIGILVAAPRDVGPPTDPNASPTVSPEPTLTPEDALRLTEPGDEIRIAALDGEGQFGTITIRRGEEKAGYEGFVPFAFQDVFFVELYIKYQPDRVTDENYGEWEFAFAADVDRNGFDEGDVVQRGAGFLGMETMPGFESAPQPILYGKRSGDEVLEGWLVLEVPAAAANRDLYLVYGHGEWTNGIQNMVPELSALLRLAGDPVGISEFDPNYFPSPDPDATPMPMPSWHALPTPMPSTAPTFGPMADADADALFAETQSCANPDLSVTITFPAAWYTNEPFEDPFGYPISACSVFSPDPIEPDLLFSGLTDQAFIAFNERPEFVGGIEEPTTERVPIGDRTAWRITFTEDQNSYGTTYLMPVGDDPYGPFVAAFVPDDEMRAVLERMLLRLVFED